VVGESADFMEANVEAGKVYYATVVPRMGFWKARFSLDPLHKYEFDSKPEELHEWMADCEWVMKTPATQKWFEENAVDIDEKYRKYYEVWKVKDEKPVMTVEDGL
ncbi:MAG: hypothetical protein R3302_08755, partial [Sulfurimonadaceae bacterium]|nr:hypothetical protein [Sulfurimonadaceae bacterium]